MRAALAAAALLAGLEPCAGLGKQVMEWPHYSDFPPQPPDHLAGGAGATTDADGLLVDQGGWLESVSGGLERLQAAVLAALGWSDSEKLPRPAFGRVLFAGRTPYQHLAVEEMGDLEAGGTRLLLLDDSVQLTEHGEAWYHEIMANVPLMAHRPCGADLPGGTSVRDIFMFGSGDGGVALRLLRHKEVRHITQVDIDKAVVAASMRYFPRLAAAYKDPRLKLTVGDAIAFVADRAEKIRALLAAADKEADAAAAQAARDKADALRFDAFVIDTTDVLLAPQKQEGDGYGLPSANATVGLWSADFYRNLHDMLRPGGVGIQNAQSAVHGPAIRSLLRLMGTAFSGRDRQVVPLAMSTPDYVSPYVLALLRKECAAEAHNEASAWEQDVLGARWLVGGSYDRLQARWRAAGVEAEIYSPQHHLGVFLSVPASLVRGLEQDAEEDRAAGAKAQSKAGAAPAAAKRSTEL